MANTGAAGKYDAPDEQRRGGGSGAVVGRDEQWRGRGEPTADTADRCRGGIGTTTQLSRMQQEESINSRGISSGSSRGITSGSSGGGGGGGGGGVRVGCT